MSKLESIENVRHSQLDGWKALAEDAEVELERANDRVRRLREAVRIFRDNAERGEFYPTIEHQPTNA